MCLTVPGLIVSVQGEGIERVAQARFGQLMLPIHLALTPEAEVGDHIIASAGYSTQVLNPDVVEKVFESLEAMGVLNR